MSHKLLCSEYIIVYHTYIYIYIINMLIYFYTYIVART